MVEGYRHCKDTDLLIKEIRKNKKQKEEDNKMNFKEYLEIESVMAEIYNKLFNVYESLPNNHEILDLVKQYKDLNIKLYLLESKLNR